MLELLENARINGNTPTFAPKARRSVCFSSHQTSRRRREGWCVSVYTNLRAEGAKAACLHTTILPVLCSRYIVYMYYMYYIYYMYCLKSIFVFYIAVLFVLIVFLFMMLALLRCYTSIFDGFIRIYVFALRDFQPHKPKVNSSFFLNAEHPS